MEEHRLNQRYTPGAAFPLQAYLSLAKYDWRPAKVENLSGNGAGLLIAPGPNPVADQPARVQLVLGALKLEIDARLVHHQGRIKGIYCGVAYNFSDFPVQKAYLQLLQPIALGQSLKAVPTERITQNEPHLIKQVFRGESDSVLTVWLEKTMGTPLHRFEFQMQDYFCRAEAKTGVLEAYTREAADSFKGKLSNPVFDTSGGLQDEIRQLFRWIVPNLSPAVPDDLRAVLQGFAG